MAVPSPTPDKSALRAEGLRRRRDYAASLTPELRGTLERRLAELVLPHLLQARIVGGYHPLRDEISPQPLLSLLDPSQRTGFPWFAERDSRFIWREGPATEPSPWGVRQPSAKAEALAPDVVLVPLVLADRCGTRIGHGKGHYDRALAHLRESGAVFAIGLGWDEQISSTPLPPEPWDMKLDAIATPAEWIACG